MWVTRREIARLERELKTALQRAKSAEDDLRAERASKDWLTVQLASRLAAKAGTYGLDSEPPKPVELTHPKGFLREPDEVDTAKLEYYKKCFSDAGKSEIEAERFWEAEMRGEAPTIEAEQEQ